MKIVDRETFLKLPPGTLYAKFSDPIEPRTVDMGPLCIKAGHRGVPPVDWYATDLATWPECNDTGELLDVFDRLKAGEDLPPDWDCSTGDGFFDRDQLFAVLTKPDVDALIDRLKRAKVEAFG